MLFYVCSPFLEGVQKCQRSIRRKIGAKNIIFYCLYTHQQRWKMNCKHILFISLLISIFAIYIQWVLARVIAFIIISGTFLCIESVMHVRVAFTQLLLFYEIRCTTSSYINIGLSRNSSTIFSFYERTKRTTKVNWIGHNMTNVL